MGGTDPANIGRCRRRRIVEDRISARTRQKRAGRGRAEGAPCTGMDEPNDKLTETYRRVVERIRGYPMSEAARKRILAEVEAVYRRQVAELRAADQRSSTSSL